VQKDLAGGRLRQGDGVYADRWTRRTMRLREVNEAFLHYDHGMERYRKKAYRPALAAADAAVRLRRDQAPFHRLRGDALLELGKPADARRAYERALAVDPRYVPARTGLGYVAYGEGRFLESESRFEAAAAENPNSVMAWYGLGASRYRLGRYAEGIGPLEKVAGVVSHPNVYYKLAVCYDRTGVQRSAYAAYTRAVETGLAGEERRVAIDRLRALRAYAPASL
jgi:tetratricopeptide (TPR) repeat protein